MTHLRSFYLCLTIHCLLYFPLYLFASENGSQDVPISEDTLDDLFHDEMPIVLTASRLRQPHTEAPASVTIIDAEQIKAFNIRTLPEIFRLVPGMLVGYEREAQAEVGYQILTAENSHYLQVLIDGRSVYRPALAGVLWNEFPLLLEKIARIEVIRGPNTAMYGANSYLAIINIITKQAEDMLGGFAAITKGNKGIEDARFSYGWQKDHFSATVSAGHKSSDGFDFDNEPSDAFDRVDTNTADFVNLDLYWKQSETDFMRWETGISNSRKAIDDIDDREPVPFHNLKIDTYFSHFTWNYQLNQQHELKFQTFVNKSDIEQEFLITDFSLFFSNELFALNSNYPQHAQTTLGFISGLIDGSIPLGTPLPPGPDAAADNFANAVLARAFNGGIDPTTGLANQNLIESRFDIELQDTWIVNENLRLVSGLSYRFDQVESQTYFNGTENKNIGRLFSNVEWRFNPSWLFNAGVMFEFDDLIGNEASPRLALNYLVSPRQSFRFILSKANRSPDLYEELANIRYTLEDLTPEVNPNTDLGDFFLSARSSGNLRYEQIISQELGWYFRSKNNIWEIDLKLYQNKLYDLLLGLGNLNTFNLRNGGRVDTNGFESQIRWTPNASTSFWLTSAYTNTTNENDDFFVKTISPVNVTLSGQFAFTERLSLASSYTFYDEWFLNTIRKLNTTLTYSGNIGKHALKTQLTVDHRFDDGYLLDVRSRYNDPQVVYATVSFSW